MPQEKFVIVPQTRAVEKVGVRGGKGSDEVGEGRLGIIKRRSGDGFQAHEKYRELPLEGFAEGLVFLDFEVGDQRLLVRSVAGAGEVDVEEGFQRLKKARFLEILGADEDVSGTAGHHHEPDE